MRLESRFDVGDVVYVPAWKRVTKRVQCPDCEGVKAWRCILPNGTFYNIACPSCKIDGYTSCGKVNETALEFEVDVYCVGEVRYDERGFTYIMEEEPGEGNRVIDEEKLDRTRALAETGRERLLEDYQAGQDRAGVQEEARKKRAKSCAGDMVSFYRNELRKARAEVRRLTERLERVI